MRRFLFYFTLVLAVSAGAGALWFDASRIAALNHPLDVPPEGLTYVVEAGDSLTGIASDLGRRGVMPSPHFLVLHARWEGSAGRIQAGEYVIVPGTTPLGLLDLLVSGKVVQHALTLVDGWAASQVFEAVAAHPVLVHTLDGGDPQAIMEGIGQPGVHPEGRFFADTYHFPRGTTDLEFLKRAYDTMEAVLAREWAGRRENLPYKSPYEALILASIVEKETGVAEERARIAGVFVRRLRKGMRLETDPTVIYGLGPSFDGNLRRRDLRRDTPYNTYVHKGLPPTPIAIPGQGAIRAVMHPQTGNELFFVAKGDGRHHFSATYDEHRRAVARYQKRRGRKAGG